MQGKTNVKTVGTVERERERATFRKIGFFKYGKIYKENKKIDYC